MLGHQHWCEKGATRCEDAGGEKDRGEQNRQVKYWILLGFCIPISLVAFHDLIMMFMFVVGLM